MRALLCVAICFIAGCGSSPAPRSTTVMFTGDSITQFWGQSGDFQANWVNDGISGQKCSDIAARFTQDLANDSPGTVHILCGTNDLSPNWTLAASTFYIVEMIQQAQAHGIRVVIGTVPPWGSGFESTFVDGQNNDTDTARDARVSELNNWIRQYASDHSLTLVDYYAVLNQNGTTLYVPSLTTDGVHPTQAGFDAMTKAVTSAL